MTSPLKQYEIWSTSRRAKETPKSSDGQLKPAKRQRLGQRLRGSVDEDYSSDSSTDSAQTLTVKRLRRKRNSVKQTGTLQDITIRAIFRSHEYFCRIGNPENPFRFLPNTIVQNFLKLLGFKEDELSCRNLLPKLKELAFLNLLLNPNVTEVNCDNFQDFDGGSRSGKYVMQHVTKRCPKITKVQISLEENQNSVEVPVLKLKTWTNLKHFGMRGYLCTDNVMRQIRKYLPRLEGMEFNVAPGQFTWASLEYFSKMQNLKRLSRGIGCDVTLDQFTMKSVDILSKMKNLKYLSITVNGNKQRDFQEIAAHVAGKVPKLQKINLEMDFYSEFLQIYGEYYPQKRLLIESVRLTMGNSTNILTDWPSALALEHLTVQGPLNEEDVEKICTTSPPLKGLTLKWMEPYQVYPTVEKLGSSVKEFELSRIFSNRGELLDMYRVFSACPEIENFSFTDGRFGTFRVEPILRPLAPHHFKKFKSFEISALKDDENSKVVFQIYKMFLMGSENHGKKLLVNDEMQLEVVAQALREEPKCLKKLQTLDMNFMSNYKNVFEIATTLIHRSPYLMNMGLGVCYPSTYDEVMFEQRYNLEELARGVGVRMEMKTLYESYE